MTKKLKKVDWESLTYSEMVREVEKLSGKRPDIPKDLSEVSWSEQALRVLRERYFLKDDNGNPIETVREMCWRVAWELSRAEVKFGKGRREVINLAREFYNLLASRNFLPNSPTLMNAGKSNGMQYNGCYVIPVGDSLIEIFDAVKWQAVIHQSVAEQVFRLVGSVQVVLE